VRALLLQAGNGKDTQMKTSLVFVTMLLAASAASAAVPGKTMDTKAGKVYVDDKGMTLYVYDNDKQNRSNCYGKCADVWPPYMAEAKAKRMGEWTLVKRKDGSKMWAYDKHPLYTYVKDKKPGDVTGDGMGGVWHIAKP
jgi:predicted lipoprotein with Yx(FWY)xxD motif